MKRSISLVAFLIPFLFSGWKQMDVAPSYGPGPNMPAFEKELTLSGAGNSDWILIPNGIDIVTITIVPAGGASGKVQSTTDLINTVKTGSPSTEDWSYGFVASLKSGTSYPVTAVRLVQSGSGTCKIKVRAQ